MSYMNFFVISQAGVIDAGLQDETDLNDWAIIEYIHDLKRRNDTERSGTMRRVDYRDVVEQIPLLAVKTKQGVSNRITKLRKLGLVDTRRSRETGYLFAELTEKAKQCIGFSD